MTSNRPLKLNAHLAIDARRRKEAHEKITDLHKATQNAHLMTGMYKVYTPSQEDGTPFPPETKKVQLRIQDALEQVGGALASLFDTTATKDFTNTIAKADIIVDGTTMLEGVPVTFLLFLEKELRDMRTFVSKVLELDPAEDWVYDESTGVHKTPAVLTQKTAKIQESVVVVPATDKFPAQVKDQTRDVIIGQWSTTKLSGGIKSSDREAILRRITKLEEAVKSARERANLVEVTQISAGQRFVDYIFKGK